MTCPGYPAAVEGLPNPDSEYAAEGTAAHAISDMCLTLGMDPFDFVESVQQVGDFIFTWTEDDAELMMPGIDQIRGFEGRFFGEHKVDLSEWLGPNQFGTLDRAVVTPTLIVVGDLKWGRGIPVSPVENKQLRLYGLGFWQNVARHLTAATDFLFIIDQPRCGAGGGEWRCTLSELLAFGEEAKAAAERTNDPAALRIASEKGCLWCLRRQQPPSEPGALSGCAAFDAYNLAILNMKFDEEDEAPGEGIDALDAVCSTPPLGDPGPDRRAYILRHKGMVERWLEHLHTDAISDALAGRPTPGNKVVAGRRGPRKWADAATLDGALELLMGDARFAAPSLKSPTQVEKEISDEDFAGLHRLGLIAQSDPKPVLVPEADARPALPTAHHKFDEEEG